MIIATYNRDFFLQIRNTIVFDDSFHDRLFDSISIEFEKTRFN